MEFVEFIVNLGRLGVGFFLIFLVWVMLVSMVVEMVVVMVLNFILMGMVGEVGESEVVRDYSEVYSVEDDEGLVVERN